MKIFFITPFFVTKFKRKTGWTTNQNRNINFEIIQILKIVTRKLSKMFHMKHLPDKTDFSFQITTDTRCSLQPVDNDYEIIRASILSYICNNRLLPLVFSNLAKEAGLVL